MNTYFKFCPNVWAAKCDEKHEQGEIIHMTTKRGEGHAVEVWNHLGQSKDGKHLYSVTRLDGKTNQTRAAAKAEKLEIYSNNAEKRSAEYYEKSKEGRDFLRLGEPIKIGHHSERRHRKLIERNWERMGKSVAESEKAKEYARRAEYWAERAARIDLSTPDSLEYFEEQLRQAKERHKILKDNPERRDHGMSLQYANKAVKELQDKVNAAIRLWGDEEEIKQLNEEKRKEAEAKAAKSKKKHDIITKYRGFFAFNTQQFQEGAEKLRSTGELGENEKLVHIVGGLYIPKKNAEAFLAEWR